MEHAQKFIPLDALATTLGIPRTWLRSLADSGDIPCLRVGRRRLFDPAGVGQALSQRAARPEAVESEVRR